jgi:hypothetical protein
MVERSLLFLWAEVQTFDIVQERNIFANPNFCAKTPTKKATPPTISRYALRAIECKDKIDLIFFFHKITIK